MECVLSVRGVREISTKVFYGYKSFKFRFSKQFIFSKTSLKKNKTDKD
jgi:hypothetical protein